jgi:hypothetical protein
MQVRSLFKLSARLANKLSLYYCVFFIWQFFIKQLDPHLFYLEREFDLIVAGAGR